MQRVRLARRFARRGGKWQPEPEEEQRDPESVRYWAITPEELAAQVVYCIDQPAGVTISDITVRATGEDYAY